jgi:hypothetical protein
MMGEKALHPNQQKLDVHEPEKDELTAKDFEKLRAGKKAEVKKEEVEQLDEIGNTPAGQAALKAVSARGDKEMSDWNKKPESGYSSAPKKVVKHSAGGMNADRRLSGQGITKGAEGRAQRQIDYANKMRGEEIDQAAATILEYESKDGKFVHKARPGAYGGTKDEKHAVDTLSGPKEKELKAIESEKKKKMSEMVATYKEQGLKGLFEALKKEEVIVEEPTSAEFDAQLADAKQRAAGTKKQPEISKPAVQAVQNEETHTTVEFIDYNDVNGVKISEIDLEERSMTEPEMKKKEEIVKSMKKGISGFKDRYGDRAKEVMYATATKQAMKD